MSLDENLFTLNVTPSESDPAVLDLVDPRGTVHYHKQREPGLVYKINLFDPLSRALLASATAPSASSKVKTIELYNPSRVVELRSVGTLSFKWSFKWEEHEFEWKREECYMIRKPDPAVLVAVTKEPPGRLKTAAVQILDYNLNRFDIDDRKGFEIVLLTALLTFHDANDVYHAPQMRAPTSPSHASPTPAPPSPQSTRTRPSPPPKPAPKTGMDRIAEMHALRGELNEVTVNGEGSVNDYARYAAQLVEDEAMLFISVHSASPADVPKVLQIVEDVRRVRHKRGLDKSAELHQYVVYDTASPDQPRRIVLDDPTPRNARDYKPPQSLTVHLSKIDMPELAPRGPRPSASVYEPVLKPPPMPPRLLSAANSSTPSVRSTLDHPPPTVARGRTPQPVSAPSPSQLNNPSLYVAPPHARRSSAGGIWERIRR